MVNRSLSSLQIDWNGLFNTMITFVILVAMTRIMSKAMFGKQGWLPQTVKKLRFATEAIESDRDTFSEWVQTDKIQLLQAGGYYRDGRKPTLAILDDKIYAVVRYGANIKLLPVRWEDLSEETVRQAEAHGVKIAGIALLPQVKRKDMQNYQVTVECPLCGEIIEIKDYGIITRTDALKRHIELKHSGKAKEGRGNLLPHLLIEDGELVSSQYSYLTGWISEPVPGYSLLTLLPATETQASERKIDAVLKQLKDGVESIQQSENFRLFLVTMSKFHDYSIGNQILIMIQKPAATHVAGFNTWKDLGRWVKSGERGIAILAPVMPPRPTCPWCGVKIYKGVKFCPQCGEKVDEEAIGDISPRRFRVVYVFDLSQTEGKPLPEFEIPSLTGEANEELFAKAMALAKSQGLEVSFESRPYQDPHVKGSYSGKSIWVRPEEPRAQQLKTLLHEVAHYFSEGVFQIPRRDAETIAESAAFAVGAHFGFDSGERSFPYVALWAQDKKVLEQNLSAIRKVATTIITALEGEA